MKVWITKYALTTGIFEVEDAELCLDVAPDGSMIAYQQPGCYRICMHKPHWHETREDAIFQAEEMRAKKLKSLAKQVKKLESLSFGA